MELKQRAGNINKAYLFSREAIPFGTACAEKFTLQNYYLPKWMDSANDFFSALLWKSVALCLDWHIFFFIFCLIELKKRSCLCLGLEKCSPASWYFLCMVHFTCLQVMKKHEPYTSIKYSECFSTLKQTSRHTKG